MTNPKEVALTVLTWSRDHEHYLDQVPDISELVRLDVRQQTVANVLALGGGGGVAGSVADALAPGGQPAGEGAVLHRGHRLVVPVDIVLVL